MGDRYPVVKVAAVVAIIVVGWALSDPVLSHDVAQANFARCGDGAGRRELEDRLRDLAVQRDEKNGD